MEIIDLISDLLYKHNCVIIPDFGGFVGNFKSTEFDSDRLLASPSRKKVVFNQALVENDGLLINGLMALKGIDYAQAEKEVVLFTRFLKDRLEKYKNYEFKHLGSLYLNKEGSILFVAYDGLNFYKKSYGLQDIKVKRLSRVIEKEVETVQASESTKVVPMRAERRSYYLPQIAASVAIFALFGVMFWQLMRTNDNGLVEQPIDSAVEEATASIIPDIDLTDSGFISDEDEAIQPDQVEETITYEDVTDEVIGDGGESTSVSEEQEVEQVQEQEHVDVEPSSSQETEVEDPVVDEVIATEEPTKEYVSPFGKETVYYIAVAKNFTPQIERYKRRKLEVLEYSLFEINNEGNSYLCLEKFISKKNAEDFLMLVKRYDDKFAFIFETEE
jgi:hypothetical protein